MPQRSSHFKDQAWRRIFWVSLPPGILFVIGGFFVAESPRWLFRRGKTERRPRRASPLPHSRTGRTPSCEEMDADQSPPRPHVPRQARVSESLLRRKYVIPFLLACVILFCNTATGINSIIGYNTNILLQSGLSDLQAHWGYVIFTLVNFLMTIVGMTLVDRKGRKFLLIVGTAGIIVSHARRRHALPPHRKAERRFPRSRPGARHAGPDAHAALYDRCRRGGYSLPAESNAASIPPTPRWPSSIPMADSPAPPTSSAPMTPPRRPSTSPAPRVPANKVEAFFKNPFAEPRCRPDRAAEDRQGLHRPRCPAPAHGWLVAILSLMSLPVSTPSAPASASGSRSRN